MPGSQGPIQALRSTGRAPAEACLETLAGLAPEPRLAVVCLPQADLPALLGELAGCGCRAVVLVGGGTGAAALDGEAGARGAGGGTQRTGCA